VDRAPLLFLGPARVIFGVAVAVLGVENLVWSKTTEAVIPILPWVPPYPLAAWLMGLALAALGLSIATRVRARVSALQLGILLVLCAFFLELPRLVASPLDIGIRTAFFEPLALGSAALWLAGTLPADERSGNKWDRAFAVAGAGGRYLFAVSAVVFGIDHLLIPDFIASLVPWWIPGKLFWAWATGAGFVAAGGFIAARRLENWSAGLLGLMFALWFVVLHGPRVLGMVWLSRVPDAPHKPAEWSSAFIALAMCGASWIFVQPRAAVRPETTEVASADVAVGADVAVNDASASAAA